MSPEPASQKTQVCPTCGTRLSETAVRCPVCGTDLRPKAKPSTAPRQAEKSVQAARMPEVTLSLPIALGLLVLFLAVGATVVYAALAATKRVINPTAIPTQTETATPSATPTDTQLPTLPPTVTEQAPFEYTVAAGDTCGGIAVTFGVSVQSLIILNNLPASCNNLSVGQKLKVPYPTATPAPLPTNTLEAGAATQAACDKVVVTVQENDTLSSIARRFCSSFARTCLIFASSGLAALRISRSERIPAICSFWRSRRFWSIELRREDSLALVASSRLSSSVS